jgi:ATP-binding cassette subfamily B protein
MFGRFGVVFQKDSMQCGVACLAMVCRHFGGRYSLGFLETVCSPTTEGVSLKGIADGARELGFGTAAGLVTADQLREAPLPCVLHWDQNHFTVLYKVTRRRWHVADPAKGRIAYTQQEFEKHWASTISEGEKKGIALLFEPGKDFESVKRSDGIGEKRSFRFLFRHMGQYRKYFAQIILGLLLACLLQLAVPFMTQEIVDTGIRHSDLGFIRLILLGQLMIVMGRAVTDFIRRRLLLHISMRVNITLLSDFFIKLLRLPMRFFDTKLSGDLLQRMSDHSRVQSFLTDQMLGIMFTVISFMVYGVVLLCYDAMIFAIFAVGSLIYGAWTLSFLSRRRALDNETFKVQAQSSNRTWQFITTMPEIKLQGCGGRRRAEWEETQAELFDVQMKSLKLRQTQEAGSIFIRETVNILITVVAAAAVIRGNISLGSMLAVQYVAGQLGSPVEQIMAFIYSIQDVKISLERINEIHERPDEQEDYGSQTSPDSQSIRLDDRRNPSDGSEADCAIRFDNVSFRYDRHALRNTVDGIELEIPRGKVTAIVGASGSGKTTLVKLMLGFYEPCAGEIRIGEKSLREISLEGWRARCGAVMQEGAIFSESIARNIAVGDGEVDVERLELAARTACIHDFIMGLPLKYNTVIGPDGVGLSQGQKQRMLIARAVYKNPEVIFLDEATNSLDARNEREIVANLAEFYKGRTVVIVAHRLSTVRDADNIIVLDAGRIVETGTHAELTASRGMYYNLVRNQLELGS